MNITKVTLLLVLTAAVAATGSVLWAQMSTQDAQKLVTSLRPYQC
jgi:hypothetical protein